MSNVTTVPDRPVAAAPDRQPAADAALLVYRGFKFGAAFFGWLIAISMAVLLSAAVSAVALLTAEILDYNRSDAESAPAAAGLTASVMGIVVIAVAFYSGGYVAGRLARFDGARNGFGVWMVAVLVAVLTAGAGALLNSQYDWLGDVQRPDIALSTETLATGGVIAAVALIVVTLLSAIVGGKSGQRYHEKIDRLIASED
ncbi:hypothetical protein GCM10009745_42650 [Kribbella yunnanensis]|uniref:Major facilitator superfamily (MFS) profile domain-containing protein n=1 Tax=Kribbella yunnanensis TaxID=190194 RepID=A0ABN2HS98_9ACTN